MDPGSGKTSPLIRECIFLAMIDRALINLSVIPSIQLGYLGVGTFSHPSLVSVLPILV
jgi:hypothetical protein